MGRSFLAFLGGLLVASSLALAVHPFLCRCFRGGEGWECDTVRVTDTVRQVLPVAAESVAVRYVAVRLPIVRGTDGAVRTDGLAARDMAPDTAAATAVQARCADSVEVEVPVSTKHYAGRGYEAWVSGYSARLDSIVVFGERETVRVTDCGAGLRTVSGGRGRWHIGLTCGAGLGSGGAGVFVGVGVSYSIVSF